MLVSPCISMLGLAQEHCPWIQAHLLCYLLSYLLRYPLRTDEALPRVHRQRAAAAAGRT